MKQCRVCDSPFQSGDDRKFECTQECARILASINRSDYTLDQKIAAARRKWQRISAFEFAWQRFALGVKPGNEIIFR